MSKSYQKLPKTKFGGVRVSTLKSLSKKYGVSTGMAGIKSFAHSKPIQKIIHTEISNSDLKPDSGFYGALENYTKHYKLKGKKAKTVQVYLAKTAINIARTTSGIFPEKRGFVKPSDVKAAVYFYHLPDGIDNKCDLASDQILSMEKARLKGERGKLTPKLSKWLDKFK